MTKTEGYNDGWETNVEDKESKLSLDEHAWEIIFDLMNLDLIDPDADNKKLDIAQAYILRRLDKII